MCVQQRQIRYKQKHIKTPHSLRHHGHSAFNGTHQSADHILSKQFRTVGHKAAHGCVVNKPIRHKFVHVGQQWLLLHNLFHLKCFKLLCVLVYFALESYQSHTFLFNISNAIFARHIRNKCHCWYLNHGWVKQTRKSVSPHKAPARPSSVTCQVKASPLAFSASNSFGERGNTFLQSRSIFGRW